MVNCTLTVEEAHCEVTHLTSSYILLAKASLVIISLKGTERCDLTSHPGEKTSSITSDYSGNRREFLRAAGVPGTASGRKAQRRHREECAEVGREQRASQAGGEAPAAWCGCNTECVEVVCEPGLGKGLSQVAEGSEAM